MEKVEVSSNEGVLYNAGWDFAPEGTLPPYTEDWLVWLYETPSHAPPLNIGLSIKIMTSETMNEVSVTLPNRPAVALTAEPGSNGMIWTGVIVVVTEGNVPLSITGKDTADNNFLAFSDTTPKIIPRRSSPWSPNIATGADTVHRLGSSIPPYVKTVKVTSGGGTIYHAGWEYANLDEQLEF